MSIPYSYSSLGLLDVMGIITAEATENPEPQPLVPWWSFSKTVLAAAALVLVDRRKLTLDVPVAGAQYTLRHLLQHTSGLPDYGPSPDYQRAVAASDSPWTVNELLRRVNPRLKEAAGTLDDGQPFKNLFKFGRSAHRSRIGKFHSLNNMPGWRNWQTHRT